MEPPSTPDGGLGGYCPLGNWHEYGHYCYYFSTTTFDHDGAIADCRAQGGTSHVTSLASIESVYENEFIIQQIRGDPYNYGSWIGLIRSQLGSTYLSCVSSASQYVPYNSRSVPVFHPLDSTYLSCSIPYYM